MQSAFFTELYKIYNDSYRLLTKHSFPTEATRWQIQLEPAEYSLSNQPTLLIFVHEILLLEYLSRKWPDLNNVGTHLPERKFRPEGCRFIYFLRKSWGGSGAIVAEGLHCDTFRRRRRAVYASARLLQQRQRDVTGILWRHRCYDSTHTHTRLTALCPWLPGWAGTRKVKPIWILLKQETLSCSEIRWAICKSAPCSRQITTPAPHRSVFYRPDALPAAQPTASKHWRHEHWRHVINTVLRVSLLRQRYAYKRHCDFNSIRLQLVNSS